MQEELARKEVSETIVQENVVDTEIQSIEEKIDVVLKPEETNTTVSEIKEIVLIEDDAKLIEDLNEDEVVDIAPVVDEGLYNYEVIEDLIPEETNEVEAQFETLEESLEENLEVAKEEEAVDQIQTEEPLEDLAIDEDEIDKLLEQDEMSLELPEYIGELDENSEYKLDTEETSLAIVNNSFANKLRTILNQFTTFIASTQEPGMSKTPRISKSQKINVYGTYADYKKRNKIDRVVNLMNEKPLKVKRVHHTKEYCKQVITKERNAFIEDLYKEINTTMYKFEKPKPAEEVLEAVEQ